MNKKISLGLSIALIILSITATFAITMAASKSIYNKIINNLSLRTSASSAIEEISEIVSGYFYGTVDDRTAVITSAVAKGYVEGLGDPNSSYLSSEEYEAYTERLAGKLSGIGIETHFDSAQDKLLVAYVYEASPAQTAGLEKGDVIVEIDGTAVTRKNYAALTRSLYGGKLSSVEIRYLRDGEEDTVEPMLGFDLPTVTSKMTGTLAYVRVTAFYKDTPSEFAEQIKAMQESGATGIIIDLRGTGEGTIEYAAQTLDVLVPAPSGSQNLAATYDKDGNKKEVFTAESSSVNSSYVVLVNSATAGPAELFACDLRDISAAKVVGVTTKGIGTVQKAFPLNSGDAAILTVARIEPYIPDNAYDGVGIEPEYPCELAQGEGANLYMLEQADDAQLTTAISLFS